eukprot:4477755-Pyramimonas_sp.AAC.1
MGRQTPRDRRPRLQDLARDEPRGQAAERHQAVVGPVDLPQARPISAPIPRPRVGRRILDQLQGPERVADLCLLGHHGGKGVLQDQCAP